MNDLNYQVGQAVKTYPFTNAKSRAVYLDDIVDTFAGHGRSYNSCAIGCSSSWRANFDFNGDGEKASCATGSPYIASGDSYAIHPSTNGGHVALAQDGYELLESLYGN
jgi:hypothetical protein